MKSNDMQIFLFLNKFGEECGNGGNVFRTFHYHYTPYAMMKNCTVLVSVRLILQNNFNLKLKINISINITSTPHHGKSDSSETPLLRSSPSEKSLPIKYLVGNGIMPSLHPALVKLSAFRVCANLDVPQAPLGPQMVCEMSWQGVPAEMLPSQHAPQTDRSLNSGSGGSGAHVQSP